MIIRRADQEPQDRVYGNLLFFIGRTREDDIDFVNATVWQRFEILGNEVWRRVGTIDDEMRWGIIPNGATYPVPSDDTYDCPPVNQYYFPTFGPSTENHPYILVYQIVGDPDDAAGTDPFTGEAKAIVVFENGDTELVYYGRSTQASAMTWPRLVSQWWYLGKLLRGLQGTETMLLDWGDDHPDSLVDTGRLHVVFLDPETKPIIARYPIESVGEDLVFRVTAFNQSLEEAEDIVITPEGRSLMPYAPGSVNGERRGNGDIWVTFERRTRVEGQIVEGRPGVPLYEDYEKYEVEIYYPVGVLVRTILAEDIGDTTAVYTLAQQTEDSVPATAVSIWAKVFQLSAQVGRGFGRKTEVQLNADPAKGAY